MLENLQPEQGNAKKNNLTGLVVFILIVVILGLAWYFLMIKGQKPVAIAPQTPTQDQTKQEVQSLVASVGKLMVLPTEEPLVATIDDPSALQKEQPFYAGSEKGDKLLIFFQARKAVIYNPVRNVIVNAGPIIMQQDQAAVQQAAEPAPQPKKK